MSDGEDACCAVCGALTRIEKLDAKPENLSEYEKPLSLTDWITRIFRPKRWRLIALSRAADAGEQFERLECEKCYGPGWLPL